MVVKRWCEIQQNPIVFGEVRVSPLHCKVLESNSFSKSTFHLYFTYTSPRFYELCKHDRQLERSVNCLCASNAYTCKLYLYNLQVILLHQLYLTGLMQSMFELACLQSSLPHFCFLNTRGAECFMQTILLAYHLLI